ncbi:MAG: methyltransferase domain-containing protein [Chloroflexi bacterium]|nr:methyltransferase domain-containing protein [Chloroflexota bacterium]
MAGDKVLDVAAGRGAILFPAAELVGETGDVIGIDLAEGMVSATMKDIKARGIGNASMQVMDAENLEFESNFFDRVACGFALFFFPNLDKALREFLRVLKQGGVLAATTFGDAEDQMGWYEAMLEKYNLARDIPVTESLERPEDPHNAFNAAGFSDIQITKESFDSTYNDEEEWWAHLWKTADRSPLETLSDGQLDSLKKEAFADIQALKDADGIRVPYTVLFTIGKRITEKM